VIAVDTNVLVYAHKRESPWHDQALAALQALVRSAEPWALPWPCLHEFYSVATNPRLYQPTSTPEQALAQIDAWVAAPNARLLAEGHDHFARLIDLVRAADVRGPKVHDAKIAAICLAHGVRELLTMDRDFSRYPALKTRSLVA